MKRTTLLTGGAVATALVLAAGAVTVASAVGVPAGSSRVLDDRGVDTATVSPAPAPSGSPRATPQAGDDAQPGVAPQGDDPQQPGDDRGHHGVVAVPPAGPTVIDRHGDPAAPDDHPGAHEQSGQDDDHGGSGAEGGDGSGSGDHSGSEDGGSGHRGGGAR